jgi:spermidine synthase
MIDMACDTSGLAAPPGDAHVRPFVYEAGGRRALHFSICAIQSRIDLDQPDRLDLEYTRLMMAFALIHPRPSRIGMIGLGGGSLVRFCHRHLPQARIEVAECNPHVIALRDQFMVPHDDERLKVLECDGASYVRQATGLDVLLVDGYDAWGLPRSLSSQRFFGDCARALAPQGVLVMNLLCDPERRTKVLDRIRRAFGGVALAVTDRGYSNSVAFAARGAALSGLACGAAGPLASRPDASAWLALDADFARVCAAWNEEFA